MALRSILLKSGQTKLWLNSSAVVYIVYLFIYITRDKIYSSAVCFTKNDANRTCQCVNNNSTAVQCLLTNISNPSCQLMARESYKYFCEVMSQFNCETMYSVKWNCTDCLVSGSLSFVNYGLITMQGESIVSRIRKNMCTSFLCEFQKNLLL